MLNKTKQILFSTLFISFLILITSQEIETIKIGQIIKGSMPLDESHKYYILTIPKSASGKLLIFTTHEDSSINKDIKDSFSDPDFYISKKNKYPSSRRSSEWFSEQYGSDILSIPSESVKENEIFYIGMYCQYKCKYFLKIETGIETEIKLKETYYLRLKPKETMNYKITIKNEFEKLKVIAYSKTGGKFKLFMNQNSPSSANTYKVIPSWESGYVIIINKDSREYCTNCEYHIIIHNEGDDENKEVNQIIFFAEEENKDHIYNLKQFNRVADALEDNSKRCFNFNITKREKENEKLIIDIVVFSGYATLLIEGWKSKNINNKAKAQKETYSHDIVMEKYILLTKKDFDNFDQENNDFSGKDSMLNFCLYSGKQISYFINAYYLTSLDKIAHNILMQGNQLKGYLLKDQVINYELLIDNENILKNKIESNITITINKIVGNISSYGYFCQEENCKLNSKYDIEKLEERNKLLIPKKELNPFISTLVIPYNDNICMKNPVNVLDNGNKINCATYAIIECNNPTEGNDLCIYDIQFTVKDTEIIMKPKQLYSGMIYTGKTDKYRITISDPNIESFFVVLNTESGDAQLSVYLEDETSYRKESLLSISSHNDYIPDVVKITKGKIRKENVVGKYIVKIYPETLSYYQVYYYALYKKEMSNIDKSPEVTMNLKRGILTVDYFPNDIRYKIYSYTPLLNKRENIKVFINRVNIDFNIYIYSDISKFEIEQLFDLQRNLDKEPIKGYLYKSNANNEVIIPKEDISLNLNKNIYIIIAPTDPFLLRDKMNSNSNNEEKSKEDLDKKAVSQFYLGVTSENIPLSIKEGMPHTMTLSNSYSHQIYQRIHTNIKKDLQLVINVLLGQIDIFASTKFLSEKDIANIDIKDAKYDVLTETYEINKIKFKLNMNQLSILEIDKNFMTENMSNLRGTYIYYYIRRSESIAKENKVCQYIILEKTNEIKGQILQPGVVTSGKIQVGNKAYFIIEEIEKRKWAFINVIFKKGGGNVYLRIPNVPESHNNIRFPNEGNYDYKGNFIYSGRNILIPEKEFQRLDSKNNKLQFLITITAESGNEEFVSSSDIKVIKKEVEFSISYSNEPKRINQNNPYDGYISQGEFQYYNLYFDKSTQNIYIGLTKMNGDADMYLNRGKNLPSTDKYDWSSTESGHEYIDIGKDDYFFQNGKNSISGYYTLLLVGFADTSFSLFVSTHEKKVFPLRDNIPTTCWCENKGEKCFFRYQNVFDKNNAENGINHNEVIFTSQYLYGNGNMYSKIFIDSELHNSENFYKSFPDSNNYDYSNKESNQRNYIKVKVDGEKYTKDTSILLTFECSEKTKVDITTTSLIHFSSVDYIRENHENIFYLGMNDITNNIPKLSLIFNNIEKDQDLIYSVHSYIGDAHFKVYGNSSYWDVKSQHVVYDYKLLNEFDLITNDKYQDLNIDVYNPYTHDYHNYIPKNIKEKYDDIYFHVEPRSEFGFFIQCNFDKSWNKLQIGKYQTFYVINSEFFGYFDINEEYENIEFSLNVDNNLKIYAELFIKLNIIDKNEITQIKKNPEKRNDEFSLYHYSIPSADNFDYKSITDKTLGTISLNLNKLPKLELEEIEKGKKNKIIRALFYVRLGELGFTPIKEEESTDTIEDTDQDSRDKKEDENELNNQNENNDSSSNSKTKINIVVTPGMNNFKYMDLKPYEYYFSNLIYNPEQTERPIETKVYSLTRENLDHDIMVIEISACQGYYEINIQEEIINKENLNKKSINYIESDEKGKKIIYLESLKSKHYYLSVRPLSNTLLCVVNKRDKDKCAFNLQYLIYYYTSFTDSLSFQEVDKWISHRPYGKGRIRLDLPLIITKDLDFNKQISDYKFDVFATFDKERTNNMGNICYLSRLIPNNEEVFKLQSLSIENKNALIISDLLPGKTYYINVLAQNIKTKELITFHPIKVFAGGRPPREWLAFIRNIFIACLIIFLIYYFYQYRKTRDELIFFKGEAMAKTQREISGMGDSNDFQTIKYSTIGSSY